MNEQHLNAYSKLVSDVVIDICGVLLADTLYEQTIRVSGIVAEGMKNAFEMGARYGLERGNRTTVDVAAHLIAQVIDTANDRIASEQRQGIHKSFPADGDFQSGGAHSVGCCTNDQSDR